MRLIEPHDPEKVYVDLVRLFLKNLEPIRKNRNIHRNKRVQKISGKYKPMKNYKRAV